VLFQLHTVLRHIQCDPSSLPRFHSPIQTQYVLIMQRLNQPAVTLHLLKLPLPFILRYRSAGSMGLGRTSQAALISSRSVTGHTSMPCFRRRPRGAPWLWLLLLLVLFAAMFGFHVFVNAILVCTNASHEEFIPDCGVPDLRSNRWTVPRSNGH
jgi:hypothetical protein